MPTNSTDRDSAGTTAAGVSSQVSEAATRAKDKAADLGQTAVEKVDGQRDTAAGHLETAASALHARANQLPGGQAVSGFAHSTADTLTSTADYVRQNDVKRMMTDLEQVVTRNPGPSLLAAAVVGFLVGRVLSSND